MSKTYVTFARKFKINQIMGLLSKITEFFRKPINSAPVVMFTKSSDIKEFSNIDEAIKELESDPNISKEKIKKLKNSIELFKNKGRIKIQNGEIID